MKCTSEWEGLKQLFVKSFYTSGFSVHRRAVPRINSPPPRISLHMHGPCFLMNESEIMAKMVKISSYFTQSSEADECNNMELLPEGDNQLLCESEKELGWDNDSSGIELPQNSDNL